MFLSHLQVMLWKNIHMRRYYPVLTILELVLPIVIFHQGLSYRQWLETESDKSANNTWRNQTWIYSPVENYSYIIYYTPENTFTSDLLATLSNMSTLTILSYNLTDFVSLESSLADELSSHRTNLKAKRLFGVRFESGSKDENFRYTIVSLYPLLQKDSRTYYSEKFAVATDNDDDEYLKSGFLSLQYALDSAFIRMKSEKAYQSTLESYKNISVQEFPYPANEAKRYPERLIYHLALVGFVFLALTVPYYIATEKHSGMKEMMKMIGINEFSIWFGWITYSLMIYPFVIIIIVSILKSGLTVEPFYSFVDPILLCVIFVLYCIAYMAFLFAISTLITKHWVAVVISMLVCFMTAVPFGLTDFTNDFENPQFIIFPIIRHLLLCLVPNLVLYNALKALLYFELRKHHTDWSSIVTEIDDPRIYSLRTILAYFVANLVLNGLIVLYVSSIRPGRYGTRRHLLFFLIGFYHLFRRKKKDKKSEYEQTALFSDFFEPVDESDIAVQIQDLQKTYGLFTTQTALKNINMNILKGEITVILGHNGAGKTSLLNVISGMNPKSSGEIYQNINGELVRTEKLVGKIGFCPQNVIYFNYLTVEEHILFFGMARGMSQVKATKEAHYVMSLFDMQEKSNNLVYELSFGMRRKLGLLVALIGRPEILILDEPTSGMDVNSRRITWDLLKKIRKNRVIILTTQDMEEADVVGNRIAIMHDGQIFCYGSSNFLKELFGTGYNLTLSKGRNFDEARTTQLIQNVIPSTSVTSDTSAAVEYNLPLLSSGDFSYLFKQIEENMSSLSITRIQMSCTTMDQVFMNVTFLAARNTEKAINHTPLLLKDIPVELRGGVLLVLFQIFALFMKKFKLAFRRHNRFLSIIVIALFLGWTNIEIINWNYSIFGSIEYPSINLELKTYKNSQTFIFFSTHTVKFKETYKKFVKQSGGMIMNETMFSNITEIITDFGDLHLYEMRDNLIGGVILNDTQKIVLYNDLIPHSAPISLNIYTNSLLRYVSGTNESKIETCYLPIALHERTTHCADSEFTSYILPLFWWAFIFHSAILALYVFFISFIASERVNGVKHIQTMSNLRELTYWCGNFIYDYVFYVAMIAIVISIMRVSDQHSIIPFEDLKYLIEALLVYGVSGLLYCYVYSSVFESVSMFMLINVILNVSCFVTFIAMQVKVSQLTNVFRIIVSIFPPFSFLNFLTRFLYVVINNNRCVYCLDFERDRCEETTTRISMYSSIPFWEKEIDPAHTFVKFLMIDVILYGFLLLVLNSILVARICNTLVGFIFGKDIIVDPNDEKEEDKFVQAEKEYVKNIFNRDRPNNHALVVHNLKKNMILGGWHKFTAVADVNFYVDKSTCFGIVGINGAGKSTTFKILTGFVLPTQGDAKIHNISMRKKLKTYSSMIGSCPQSDTTFEELTGREMLHLTATLRGLKKAKSHVENWISVLDMENFQDNLIETYSSGGKRRLCVAMSLIGDPKVVFLDEPTSGVDPVGRHYIYQIIKSKKLAGQSVIIASHNMRECEILCDRVTVLHNGMLKRIGSITALKKQYANGFTLLVKLRLLVMEYSDKLISVIDTILQKFEKHRCLLRDQRVELLQFRILSEEILWSEMFAWMEEIKGSNPIIEEYIITNATIAEEIFLTSLALGNPIKTLDL